MPRYSRRVGPAANFELTASFQPIPQLVVSRFFDDGELLIICKSRFLNGTVAVARVIVEITVDGSAIGHSRVVDDVPAADFGTFNPTAFWPISRGEHAIGLQASGVAAVGDLILAGGTVLAVIQLPLWERELDLG